MKLAYWFICVLILQAPAAHYRRHGRVLLNDTTVTPGALASTDTAVICHRSTKTVRHTSQAVKDAVHREYGVGPHQPAGRYEVDHLIPLELGGADTITNLWLQPAAPTPGFHQKDVLENLLHRLACTGTVPLAQAQREIATDWYAAWQHYVGGRP